MKTQLNYNGRTSPLRAAAGKYLDVHEMSTKIPSNHPYNTPKVESVLFKVGGNSIVQNSKQLYPLVNLSKSITGQLPRIIKAKKSVASFRLRKDNPVGISTTLRGVKASNFLKLLMFYFIPRLGYSTFGMRVTKLFKQYKTNHNNLSLGFKNLAVFTYITPLQLSSSSQAELKPTLQSNKHTTSLPSGEITSLTPAGEKERSAVVSPAGVKGGKRGDEAGDGKRLASLKNAREPLSFDYSQFGGQIQIKVKYLTPNLYAPNRNFLGIYYFSLILKYPFLPSVTPTP